MCGATLTTVGLLLGMCPHGGDVVRERRRPPPRCLHHFVRHPANEEGVGLGDVLDRVTMQVFVRGDCTMIAAPVQCAVGSRRAAERRRLE